MRRFTDSQKNQQPLKLQQVKTKKRLENNSFTILANVLELNQLESTARFLCTKESIRLTCVSLRHKCSSCILSLTRVSDYIQSAIIQKKNYCREYNYVYIYWYR